MGEGHPEIRSDGGVAKERVPGARVSPTRLLIRGLR